MATITTPAAGVSPYQESAAAPTVLRASADGTTVLATAASAAATVSELATAEANTSVYVAGQAALNSLITSSQPGVFAGANVNITVEEQQFVTTNQVTATTNYAAGANGSIQYNNGANGFAGDAYFTYTNSNIITPGIRTDSYLLANGAPFLAGGNAAIGNFVFTGDNMTIAHANSTLSVTGNGTGNIQVTSNGNTWTFGNNTILTLPGGPRIVPVGANLELQAAAGGYAEIVTSDGNSYVAVTSSGAEIVTSGINTWNFDNVGNLILPGNTFAVKYANGDPVVISSSGLPLANGTSNIDIATANGNVTITANGSPTWTFKSDGNLTLPTAGNIVGAVNIIGNGTGNVNVEANGRAWTFAADGNLVLPIAGNIVNYGNTWNFGTDGNLTLPANIIAINYANGNRVTGNITFRDEIVIGTGTSNLISGLYLAPSSSSADANMYLRVRGNINDEPTHIHFDTGNNQYYNQFIGDDNKYIQLANTGNIVINSNDAAGNAAQWNFDTDGNLTIPGNIIGANVISANAFTNLTGAGNVLIQSSENQAGPIATWTFDPVSNGTGNMIFPTGMHVTTDGYGGTRISQNSSNSTVGLKVTSGNNASLVTGWNEQEIVGVGNVALAAFNFDNNPGNIKIITGNLSATSYLWNFDKSGNLTFPTGNLVITPDLAAEANAAVISSTDHVLALVSNGVNGGVQSVWVEDIANIGTSNIAAVRVSPVSQTGNVQIQTGNNSSYNTWTFGTTGVLTLPKADASGFGNIYFEENSSTITFGLDDNAVPFLYSFATTGITLPTGGATIRDTVGNAVAFGRDAAATGPQGNAAVAIGQQAGETSQGASSVAIGYQAGLNTQGANSVAIGTSAGQSTQQVGAVAVGLNAGTYTQGQNAVAIGSRAGNTSQQTQSVAIGVDAAADSQGQNSVAIGSSAAAGSQGEKAVAIGLYAGNTTQGNSSVAIGDNAGYDTQGANSVAIGSYAGQSAQGNNSIILNATGVGLNAATANTFTVAPVRNDVANIAEIVFYNTTSKEITYGNTISVTGNITGNYFTGNGAGLTDVGAASVPGQTILPTIQTITVSDTSGVGNAGGGGSAFANVTVANVTPVTEYGVIVTSGTSSQKYATGALGSIPGTVKLSFTTGLNSTPFTVYAYVTSNAGTYYSNSATGTSGICLLAGTQIALSDGTHKAIEHITYTDKLLSWDFDRGRYAETTAMWIKRSETGSQYNLLTFSDGTTLRTFDQHRIFNKQAGAFTYPMTAATPVGTVTVNEHGQEITLTNKQMIEDTIEYYNVITDYHMNLFSDSVLTSCRFNNIYPITDMKFAKDSRTLRTRAEFENIEDRFFHGLRLAEQTTDIETVEWYVNRLLRTEVSTHAELAV